MAYAQSGPVRIYYDTVGDGPPLVFLHGGGGNAASWYKQVADFAGSHRCILIDNRGFGRSVPADPDLYWPKEFPNDVVAVLDGLGIGSCPIVCQSLGGWTGIRLALSHPGRVTALVISSSPMGVDVPGALEDGVAFTSSVADKRLDIETAALGEAYRTSDPGGVFLYRQLNQFNPFNDRGDGALFSGKERAKRIFAPDFLLPPAALGDVRCPILLTVGTEDRIATPRTMRAIADALPDAELLEIEAAGHSPYWERPEIFNAAVRDFLDRRAGGSDG